MCGLIFIKKLDKSSAKEQTLGRYEYQKMRGREGYGFVAMKDGEIIAYERAETEQEITAKIEGLPLADEILFHHRFPTSTPNFAEAAHPIRVSNDKLMYDYYVIHNGIIVDDEDFKKLHEKEGFKYTTEMVGGWYINGIVKGAETKWNDSEALAIELALDLEDQATGVNCTGSIAFVALQIEKTTKKAVKLFWGRNHGQPLMYHKVEGRFISLCSEGQGTMCEENRLYSLDYVTGEQSGRPYKVGWQVKEPEAVPIEYPQGIVYEAMPDEYYILCENADELRDDIAMGGNAGEDTLDLEDELKIVGERIRQMEIEYDNSLLEHYAS